MNRTINKIIFSLFISLSLSLLIFNSQASAQTATIAPTSKATPTKAASATPQDKQIEKIKDLVASRVAELKLVDKRGVLGTVKSVSNSQITLDDFNGDEAVLEIDELTKFDSSGNDDFGISDVKKGDMLSAIGLYNKQTEKLLARFVQQASNIPLNIDGVVTDKNTTDYTVTVKDANGQSKVVNIETSTKTLSYEDGESIKSGFTKIQKGERVIVVGFADKTEKDEINASRFLRLPGVALSSKMK